MGYAIFELLDDIRQFPSLFGIIIFPEVKKMEKERIFEVVADDFKTNTKTVEKEMKNAIQAAGYDMEAADFIAMVSEMVKNRLKNKSV